MSECVYFSCRKKEHNRNKSNTRNFLPVHTFFLGVVDSVLVGHHTARGFSSTGCLFCPDLLPREPVNPLPPEIFFSLFFRDIAKHRLFSSNDSQSRRS